VRFVPGEILARLIVGEGYWLAGKYDKAKEEIEQDLKLSKDCGMKFFSGWGYRLLGEIALKTNTDQAKFHFEKSIEVLRNIKAENELALAYAGFGRFYKLQRNIEEARKYLTESLEIFERLETLIEPEKVKRELIELK